MYVSLEFCTALLLYQKSSLLGNEDQEEDLCFMLVASSVLSYVYVFSFFSLLSCFQVEERAERKNKKHMRGNLIMYREEE